MDIAIKTYFLLFLPSNNYGLDCEKECTDVLLANEEYMYAVLILVCECIFLSHLFSPIYMCVF